MSCGGFNCASGTCMEFALSDNVTTITQCICDDGFRHDTTLIMNIDCSVPDRLEEILYPILSFLFCIGTLGRLSILIPFAIKTKYRRFSKDSSALRTKRKRKVFFYIKGTCISLCMFIYITFMKLGKDPFERDSNRHLWHWSFFIFGPCALLWNFAGKVIKLNAMFASKHMSITQKEEVIEWNSPKRAYATLPAIWIGLNAIGGLIVIMRLPSKHDINHYALTFNQIIMITSIAQFLATALMLYYVLNVFKTAKEALRKFRQSFVSNQSSPIKSKAASLLKRIIVMQRFVMVYVLVYMLVSAYQMIVIMLFGYSPFSFIFMYIIYTLISLEFFVAYFHASGSNARKKEKRVSVMRGNSSASRSAYGGGGNKSTRKTFQSRERNLVSSQNVASRSVISSAVTTVAADTGINYG